MQPTAPEWPLALRVQSKACNTLGIAHVGHEMPRQHWDLTGRLVTGNLE